MVNCSAICARIIGLLLSKHLGDTLPPVVKHLTFIDSRPGSCPGGGGGGGGGGAAGQILAQFPSSTSPRTDNHLNLGRHLSPATICEGSQRQQQQRQRQQGQRQDERQGQPSQLGPSVVPTCCFCHQLKCVKFHFTSTLAALKEVHAYLAG